jgi:HSP20 family protein
MWNDNFNDEMRRMRRQMNRIFQNFGNFFSNKNIDLDRELDSNYRNALAEFRETRDEYIVEIELPGVEKEDITLDIENGQMMVKAERKKEKKHISKEKGEFGIARGYFGFSRIISLPENTDTSKIDAVFKNGVLTIKLKKKKSKDYKEIQIK